MRLFISLSGSYSRGGIRKPPLPALKKPSIRFMHVELTVIECRIYHDVGNPTAVIQHACYR